MITEELILALQGEHELEYELLSELISVLEKIKDTEDDEKIEVIKKVLVFRRKVYDSGNTSYVLPQELEYLNALYLPVTPTSEETPENVVEEDISEELVEDTVTTEDTPEDTDSAGDSTTSTKTVKLTRKELSLAKKELRIKEFATLSLTEKCNADVEYDKILKQIKQIKDNLDKYNTRFIDFKKKKANKIATLEKKLEKIEDMIMLGKK